MKPVDAPLPPGALPPELCPAALILPAPPGLALPLSLPPHATHVAKHKPIDAKMGLMAVICSISLCSLQ